jgi:hypothetical protein
MTQLDLIHNSARSHPHLARSHPDQVCLPLHYSYMSLNLIHNSARSHSQPAISHPHSARSHPHSARSHPDSAHGSYCSNIGQTGLTRALLSVHIMCISRVISFLLTNDRQPSVLRYTEYMFTEAESKEKHGVWDPTPELTITSPYVHFRVDSNTFTMDNMPESTLTHCRVYFTPQSDTLDLASGCWLRNTRAKEG